VHFFCSSIFFVFVRVFFVLVADLEDAILQVELNTISVSFIALGQRVLDMHRYAAL
jgi:hypothetical protein